MDLKPATRYFLAGQACLFLSIFLSILLLPQGLFANDGISYYSVHEPSVIPYTVGLLAVAWFSFKVARALPGNYSKAIKAGYGLIALTLVVMIVFPYGINFTFEYSHTLLSAFLFVVQFFMIVWIAAKINKDLISSLLAVLLALEMLFTVMYLSPQKGYLTQGEIAFQITFAFAAYRALQYNPGKSRLKPAKAGLAKNKKAYAGS